MNRRDAEQERCWTGGIQDRWDAGQGKEGGMQDRRDSRQEGGRRDIEKQGCRKGGML